MPSPKTDDDAKFGSHVQQILARRFSCFPEDVLVELKSFSNATLERLRKNISMDDVDGSASVSEQSCSSLASSHSKTKAQIENEVEDILFEY